MVYKGTVRDGVVQIDGENRLADGTRVNIEPVEEKNGSAPADDPLFDIGRRAAPIGQTDLATNLDHYLYGHPRVGDERR